MANLISCVFRFLQIGRFQLSAWNNSTILFGGWLFFCHPTFSQPYFFFFPPRAKNQRSALTAESLRGHDLLNNWPHCRGQRWKPTCFHSQRRHTPALFHRRPTMPLFSGHNDTGLRSMLFRFRNPLRLSRALRTEALSLSKISRTECRNFLCTSVG